VLMANAPEELKTMAVEREWVQGRRHDEDGVAIAVEAALAEGLQELSYPIMGVL